MDRYRNFIDRIRQSEPTMPDNGDITERILGRIRLAEQERGLPPDTVAPQYGIHASPTARIRRIAAVSAAAAAIMTVLAVLPATVPDRTDYMTEIGHTDHMTESNAAVCSNENGMNRNNIDRYLQLKAKAELYPRAKAAAIKRYSHDNKEK